jgi:pyridinium-3,5-biscarboxylic acid mononucleotide synthase
VSDFNLDFARYARTGLEEAIFCSGKSSDHLTQIIDAAAAKNARLLLTRLSAEQHEALGKARQARLNYDPISRTAYLGDPHAPLTAHSAIAVVAAGTSDLAVSREAVRTLRYYGVFSTEFNDVGVAGLWRLIDRIEEIRSMRVVIAVAGMDAALPTVIGGLVQSVVIGVPTSVGYGIARGGETALNAMLASCASGLTVVNIDNGFGAACAALRILRA